MLRLALIACLGLLSGCISSSAPQVSTWTVEFAGDRESASSATSSGEGAPHGVVRVSQVSVRAPYDVKPIAVLRADGSVAFDPYNQFAALPSALLRGAVQDALQSRGRFAAAVSSLSRLSAELAAEVTVTRLALDCRGQGARRAVVELEVVLLKDRALYASSRGVGEADASGGDYSQAFSQAFSRAAADAMERL